jgi:hypothetical protein
MRRSSGRCGDDPIPQMDGLVSPPLETQGIETQHDTMDDIWFLRIAVPLDLYGFIW